MGARYFIDCKCPKCGHYEYDVYYAPTCGFVNWACIKCGHVVDLEELTGISYDDCSNSLEILSEAFNATISRDDVAAEKRSAEV